MSLRNHSELLNIIAMFVISFVSGFISVAQRIVRGHKATVMWVISEFMAAILCGYLMYDLYPRLLLPDWATMPIMVALAAHIGGRAFQEFEQYLYRRYAKALKLPTP